MKDGQGKFTYATGDIYVGNYNRDLRNGLGILTSASGYIYEGDWEHNKKHGQGMLTKANGDVYKGVWIYDMIQGPGKLTLANGVDLWCSCDHLKYISCKYTNGSVYNFDTQCQDNLYSHAATDIYKTYRYPFHYNFALLFIVFLASCWIVKNRN